MWDMIPFGQLYSQPSKNGLNRPRRVRGMGYKMINMGEIFAYDHICNPPMELVPMNEAEQETYGIKVGDLLFARQSLIASGAGKCSIVLEVPEITTFEGHLIRVRLDTNKADPLFYFYYFSSPEGKGNVQSLVMQVAAAGIRASELTQLPVPCPPLPTQRRIAVILSAYDDLIENNTRRIKILEQMAQMLYREWFVHFRFPGHEGARMVETAVGKVPRGWEVVPFTEAVFISPPTKVPKDTEKPYVPMSSLSHDSMLIGESETRTGNSGSKFKNRDTLFARITPCLENGKTAFVQFLPMDEDVAIGSTEFIVMRSKTLCPELVYLMARSNELRDKAIKSMTGATGRQRVQESCFEQFLFAHPDSATIQKFQANVLPMFQAIHTLARKNANLRRTRDMLLPKLVSGEIVVE
jgi:type I restriction enzyme S subunit